MMRRGQLHLKIITALEGLLSRPAAWGRDKRLQAQPLALGFLLPLHIFGEGDGFLDEIFGITAIGGLILVLFVLSYMGSRSRQRAERGKGRRGKRKGR